MNKPESLANIRIVLCQTSHPGNIGSAARAMKTMGLSDLRLVNPRKFPHAEANAMSAGATDVLEKARVCATLQEALAGCGLVIGITARQRQLSHAMVTAREATAEAVAIAVSQPVALVFGTEMSGLSNEELDQCQLLATIPANPENSSLNIASAVQVLAYELWQTAMEPSVAAARSFPLADHAEVEGFYQHLEETLIRIGFFDPQTPKRLMPRLRRLFARARLEKEEINILRGILRFMQDARKP